jgi:methylenetetrahydrofolate reductase (NADPH)
VKLSAFSLEATRPSPDELDRLREFLLPQTPIYLSRVPAESSREQAGTAVKIRRAGYEPVAHIAARRLVSAQELAEFLSYATEEAGMRRVLVIAGDGAPSGPFENSLAVIRSGKLREAGIEEIGIAAYPEPHPKIDQAVLLRAMHDKITAAKDAGLRLHIVSQFSFVPEAILGWLRRLRASGVDVPVQVGMAGPTKLPALLRYAMRCGVQASMQGLMSGAAAMLAGQATKNVGPDRIVDALRGAGTEIGDVAPHYFSFGGLNDTARYAVTVAQSAGQRAIKLTN